LLVALHADAAKKPNVLLIIADDQGQGFDEAFGFNNGHWHNYFDLVILSALRDDTARAAKTE
jgi:hypothetical protein